MEKDRMLAFTDGVFAVIITIMVLEIKPPHGATFQALWQEAPTFLTYILSFLYVGIYWNNHHHMFVVTKKTNGGIMWANLHLLFWQSLVPFATAWVGDSRAAGPPVAVYAFVLLMSGFAYSHLVRLIIRQQGPDSILQRAIGKDLKGKASLGLYLAAIAVSFFAPYVSAGLTAIPAILWLVPDRRIEGQIGLDEF